MRSTPDVQPLAGRRAVLQLHGAANPDAIASLVVAAAFNQSQPRSCCLVGGYH
jgi:hypothetical protein